LTEGTEATRAKAINATATAIPSRELARKQHFIADMRDIHLRHKLRVLYTYNFWKNPQQEARKENCKTYAQ
jgi:hypothetical protein